MCTDEIMIDSDTLPQLPSILKHYDDLQKGKAFTQEELEIVVTNLNILYIHYFLLQYNEPSEELSATLQIIQQLQKVFLLELENTKSVYI